MEQFDKHIKLQHLSNDQISNLMQRYYAREKVSDLITEFSIEVIPSQLVSTFPPKVHDDILCPYCEQPSFISKAKSRDSWTSADPTCSICGHKNINYCRCKNCQSARMELRESEELTKREIIKAEYDDSYFATPDLEELTVTDVLYLVSLVRHSSSEKLETVQPYLVDNPKLAPTYEFTNEIVKHLYAKGLILISSDSDLEAFVFDEEIESSTGYYPTRVTWLLLPQINSKERRKLIKGLEKLVSDQSIWPDQWKDKIDEFWLKIAKDECIEYLKYSAELRNLPIDKIGEKTHSIFEVVLQEYSVAQVFNLIFQSAMSTNDFATRENIPRYRAKNMFIGSIQRKADKAKAEGWTVKDSRRDFNCPQTIISSTFYDTFLGLGSNAFSMKLPQ